METSKQRNTPSKDIDAELGQRAHMIIWSRKLTQKSVARELGMSSDSLGRKLKGERGWALAEIVAMANVLGTTVAYLAGESDSPTPNPSPVGPTGIEPMTSTVEYERLAPVTPLFGRAA